MTLPLFFLNFPQTLQMVIRKSFTLNPENNLVLGSPLLSILL